MMMMMSCNLGRWEVYFFFIYIFQTESLSVSESAENNTSEIQVQVQFIEFRTQFLHSCVYNLTYSLFLFVI